jgi:hypothetical protein
MPTGLGTVLNAGIAFFVGVVLFVFFLRRLLSWMDQRGWILYSGDPPTYGSLGNAFQELQSMAEPQIQYVLEVKQEEESEEDGEAGPDDPTRHLRRQLKRILEQQAGREIQSEAKNNSADTDLSRGL